MVTTARCVSCPPEFATVPTTPCDSTPLSFINIGDRWFLSQQLRKEKYLYCYQVWNNVRIHFQGKFFSVFLLIYVTCLNPIDICVEPITSYNSRPVRNQHLDQISISFLHFIGEWVRTLKTELPRLWLETQLRLNLNVVYCLSVFIRLLKVSLFLS